MDSETLPEARQETLDTKENNGSRFKTIMALMMALVTILGAFVAWRAVLADDEAGDTDPLGWNATIATEETLTLQNARHYQNYGSYTAYLRYSELGDLIDDDLPKSPRTQTAALERQRAEAWDTAGTISDFFPLRYINHDGSYNSARELGEAWADAQQTRDLDPDRHYQKADKLRDKSNRLFVILIGFALSLWIFTLAEGIESRIRFPLGFVATALLLVGVMATLLVETGVWQ